MQTVTIDILNDKVVKLLQDLEQLDLIRMHIKDTAPVNWAAKYKGAMTKQTLDEVDSQLQQLRS